MLHCETHASQFGPGNDFICGSVEFSIDTSAAGELSGDFSVTLGNSTAKVPVSASVKPAKQGLTRVLVAETPFEKYSTKDGSHLKAWTELVKDASLDVNYLVHTRDKPVLRDLDLSKFNCVLLGNSGFFDLLDTNIKRVREFAEAGGRVVVTADHFMRGSVEIADTVLDGYGIQLRDEESRIGQKDVTADKNEIDPKLVKAGVETARFYRVSPIEVQKEKNESGPGQGDWCWARRRWVRGTRESWQG